eukprot:3424220-Rhodomonas_salina.1
MEFRKRFFVPGKSKQRRRGVMPGRISFWTSSLWTAVWCIATEKMHPKTESPGNTGNYYK